MAIAGVTLATTDTGTTYHHLAQATRIAWWLNVAYGLVVLILGIVTTTTWAKAAATATRALPPSAPAHQVQTVGPSPT